MLPELFRPTLTVCNRNSKAHDRSSNAGVDEVEQASHPFLTRLLALLLYIGGKSVKSIRWLLRNGLPPTWYTKMLVLGSLWGSWPDRRLMRTCWLGATFCSWLLIALLKLYRLLFVPGPIVGATFQDVLKSTELEMYNMTILSTKIFNWVHHFRTACPSLEDKGWQLAHMAIDESDQDRMLAEFHKYCNLVSQGTNSIQALSLRIDGTLESLSSRWLFVNSHLGQPIVLTWFKTHPFLLALDESKAQVEGDLLALIGGLDGAILSFEGAKQSFQNITTTLQKANSKLKSTTRWMFYHNHLIQELDLLQIKIDVVLKSLSYTKSRLVRNRNSVRNVAKLIRRNEQKRLRSGNMKPLSIAVLDIVEKIHRNNDKIKQARFQADQDAQIEAKRREQEHKLQKQTPFIARW